MGQKNQKGQNVAEKDRGVLERLSLFTACYLALVQQHVQTNFLLLLLLNKTQSELQNILEA